jgi:bifunctional non-homologous end joining protein LigD
MSGKRTELFIEGKSVPVSNLDKVMYPANGYTKGDVIRYYVAIAPWLLPHLRGRALTLKRYPDGITGGYFYEKRCPPHRPRWIRTTPIESKRAGGPVDYCLANDLPSLVWAANLADLELHVPLAPGRASNRPTAMVFDLDPGEGADIVRCAEVSLWLREMLTALKLECFIKTSGSKGLQLYVPFNTALSFDETRAAARQIADEVARRHPETVVTNMRKELRKKKVLIDWSQNNRHKTTVCVYSLRGTEQPSVSTPLHWHEVEALLQKSGPGRVRFTPEAVIRRVNEQGDLFAPLLTLKQRLPGLRRSRSR